MGVSTQTVWKCDLCNLSEESTANDYTKPTGWAKIIVPHPTNKTMDGVVKCVCRDCCNDIEISHAGGNKE